MIEQHSALYQVNRDLDALTAEAKFGPSEARVLINAIEERVVERWREHDYNRPYSQFADHTLSLLQSMQRNIDTLHFNVRDLALTLLIEMKKSYAAIH